MDLTLKSEEAPDDRARASSTLKMERNDDGRPSPTPNYHLERIKQPDIEEAPAKGSRSPF